MFRYTDTHPSILIRENLKRISEKTVQAIWHYLFLNTANLRTTTGQKITILDQGIWNGRDGPDFLYAKIRIGETVYQGEVEIHTRTSDWFHHGHQRQNRYARVILHAVFHHDLSTPPDHPPVLEMKSFLSASLEAIFAKIETLEQMRKNIFCYEELPHLREDRIDRWVLENGSIRFRGKMEYFRELREQRLFSWEDLLYTGLMEALGYSKNRLPFRLLAECLPLETLRALIRGKPESSALMALQAVFFGASGLLHNEADTVRDQALIPYLQRLEQLWTEWKRLHPIQTLSPRQWHLFRLRPVNYPTLRIAGFSRWLVAYRHSDLMQPFLDVFRHPLSPAELLQRLETLLIVPVYGYWNHHYLWNDSGRNQTGDLIGRQRAHEMIVNVILPVLALYAESQSLNALSEQILHVYGQAPSRENNAILKYMIQQLYRRPVNSWTPQLAQGLIHLHKRCTAFDCVDCDLFEETVRSVMKRQEDSEL